MTISDIITLLSLVIAILAIISEGNRRHLLLKFNWRDFLIIAINFVLINYFVFYDTITVNGDWMFSLLYFDDFGFDDPEIWAYLISLITLGYIIYKIWAGFFSRAQLEKVLSFYKQLIENNDVSFLLDLLDRYHKSDIKKYMNCHEQDTSHEVLSIYRQHNLTVNQKIIRFFKNGVTYAFPSSSLNRNIYANRVLFEIINNPAFLNAAANLRPYFFADIIPYFKADKRSGYPDDLIKSFLKELIDNKNFWLKKELINSQDHDYGQPIWFFQSNRILSPYFSDLDLAKANEVWIPFGDAALAEIDDEKLKQESSKLLQEYISEHTLWEFKIFFTIQFLKFLIIEAIIRKYEESHFWLYCIERISEKILRVFNLFPPNNFEQTQTNYHQLIEESIDISFLWLKLSNTHEHPSIYHDIIRCIGSTVHYVTFNAYYGENRKIKLLDRLLTMYCNLEEKGQTDDIRIELENILIKPSALTERNHPYYEIIKHAWSNFDKIRHRNGMRGDDYMYFKRLKNKVIIPLDLDPS